MAGRFVVVEAWGAAVLLVPGDPVAVSQFAGRLLDLARGFFDAAQRVRLVQANGWTGASASAFAGVRELHVDSFVAASEAFGSAGAAVGGYGRVLAAAQGAAGRAVHVHAEAEMATARWQAARAAVRAQGKEAAQTHTAHVAVPATRVLLAADPGAAGRLRAEQIVAGARADVRQAAARAAVLLSRAADQAPTHRTVGSWLASWVNGPGGLPGQLQAGAARAVEDLAVNAWQTSTPGIAWGLAHSERPDWWQVLDAAQTWSAPPTEQVNADRLQPVDGLVDAHDWASDPARAAGYTATNLVMLLAGDGLGDAAEGTEGVAVTARAPEPTPVPVREAEVLRPASSAVTRTLLAKSLASEAQIAQTGRAIAGAGSSVPLRDAWRLAALYGGKAPDWAKMTSTRYRNEDGLVMQTHWYEDLRTGQRVEYKTKVKHPRES